MAHPILVQISDTHRVVYDDTISCKVLQVAEKGGKRGICWKGVSWWRDGTRPGLIAERCLEKLGDVEASRTWTGRLVVFLKGKMGPGAVPEYLLESRRVPKDDWHDGALEALGAV